MEKLVSIIIPCHKNNIFLDKCISSAKSQNSATVIVVIDSKCHGLHEKIANLEPDVILNANVQSPSKAREIGISAAKTKYIAFLDSDDWIIKKRLDEQVNWMEKNQIKWSCTPFYLRRNEKIIGHKKTKDLVDYSDLLKRNCIGNSSVIILKSILPQNLPSEPLEDFKLWLLMSKNLKCAQFNQFGRIYNIHSKQISRNYLKTLTNRYCVLNMHIGILLSIYYIIMYHIIENILIRLGYQK